MRVCRQLNQEGVVNSSVLNITKLICMLVLVTAAVSCNSTSSEDQRRRDEKTREEAAKATERIKPELKEAGKELGQAAREAADDARAAAQGVKDGWSRDHSHPLNLNTATESDLESLPGITKTDVERIIRNRPYRSKNDLVNKRILSEAEYDQIRDYVTTD
jgi:DNA uptake protein ComE-like DNA-binding protein